MDKQCFQCMQPAQFMCADCQGNFCSKKCAAAVDGKMLKEIMAKKVLEAIENDDVEGLAILLQRELDSEDLSFKNNRPLVLASERGYLDIVNLLLDHDVDPSEPGNYALLMASKNGHLEVVERLLKDRRVKKAPLDPSIRYAQNNGHLEIVRLLENAR